MTTNEIIETAIQGHASTRDAIRWAIEQEREACAQIAFAAKTYLEATAAIRARGQAIEQAEKPEAQRHISYVCPNCHWSLDRLKQPDHLRDATKKVWVGLTGGEIGEEVLKRWPSQNTFMGGALWAEAKLMERNSG